LKNCSLMYPYNVGLSIGYIDMFKAVGLSPFTELTQVRRPLMDARFTRYTGRAELRGEWGWGAGGGGSEEWGVIEEGVG